MRRQNAYVFGIANKFRSVILTFAWKITKDLGEDGALTSSVFQEGGLSEGSSKTAS
jgi:hypothetical protein